MLDHFFRTTHLSRLKFYHSKKTQDDLELSRLKVRELRLMQAIKEKEAGRKIPTRYGNAHSLAEVRRIVTSKQRKNK